MKELTGVDGAYRLYELHSRLDVIIGNSEKINQRLNKLSSSLHSVLQGISNLSYDLKDNFEAINKVIATQTSLSSQILSKEDDVSQRLKNIKKFQENDNDQSTRFQKYVKETLGNSVIVQA